MFALTCKFKDHADIQTTKV